MGRGRGEGSSYADSMCGRMPPRLCSCVMHTTAKYAPPHTAAASSFVSRAKVRFANTIEKKKMKVFFLNILKLKNLFKSSKWKPVQVHFNTLLQTVSTKIPKCFLCLSLPDQIYVVLVILNCLLGIVREKLAF